jgi:NAD(P)-dependent dehydrogenase (short-subunit alcohol dehydrogenase family)
MVFLDLRVQKFDRILAGLNVPMEVRMSDCLAGRVALVTGSTNNIGKAIAFELGAAGARVVVTGRDRARGAAVAEAIRDEGGEATFVALDLDGSAARSRELAEAAAAVYGPVEILVNNAGIYPPGGTLVMDDATFDRILGVNLKAPFFLAAALIPGMREAGGGVIINLGSWGTRLGIAGGTAYASTKGAIETLTRAWAAEFGAQGIRVNAISPGVTFEAGHEYVAIAGQLMANTPLGTVVDPSAVAAATVFLASDNAAAIHGTVLDVDGGRVSVLAAAP